MYAQGGDFFKGPFMVYCHGDGGNSVEKIMHLNAKHMPQNGFDEKLMFPHTQNFKGLSN